MLDHDERRRELFDAVDTCTSEMRELKARFDAAPSDHERWPLARRMIRLGPRLFALRSALERLN